MVALRLTRVGKKNHATFRLVVSDKRKDTVGSALEILGSYDPHANPPRIEFKADRVKHWLSKGAQPSDTVHNLLVEKGILDKPKKVLVKVPAKPTPEAPVAATEAAPAETPAA